MRRVAVQLASDAIHHMVDGTTTTTTTFGRRNGTANYSKTIRCVVDEVSERHSMAFEGIIRRLNINPTATTEDVQRICRRTITGVGDDLFADGHYNWGRIVTLFTFAGWLARSYRSECSDIIADVAGQYIVNKLSNWICEQGGWVSLLCCTRSLYVENEDWHLAFASASVFRE
jgi:hypothetical protein